MGELIKKLKKILIKSGLKKEEELESISDIEVQRLILDNFVQVKKPVFTLWDEKYIYILKEHFEIIEKYNEDNRTYHLILGYVILLIIEISKFF